MAVDEQPARALRHVPPHDQDSEPEDRAHPERQPPADVGREQVVVEQHERAECAAGRAEPVRAVDHQVHAPAHARGDQLVDRRVDGGVLAADAGAGEEARDVEVQRRAGERGRDRGDEVQHERHQEQLLAAEAVGELAEDQRSQAGAGDVDRARGEHLAVGQRQPAVLLRQPRGDRADDRHLEPVEDPHRPEPDHHEPVEARPGKPVQPRGDLRLDRLQFRAAAHAAAITQLSAPTRAPASPSSGSARRPGPGRRRGRRRRAARAAAASGSRRGAGGPSACAPCGCRGARGP